MRLSSTVAVEYRKCEKCFFIYNIKTVISHHFILMTTNARQFEMIVEFMIKNVDIARNLLSAPQYKTQTHALWSKLKDQLNSEGPPIKTVEGWKKVWKDYKYHIKGKMRRQKSTVGGSSNKVYKFSPLEQQIGELLELKSDADGFAAKTFGAAQFFTKDETSRTSINESSGYSPKTIWITENNNQDDENIYEAFETDMEGEEDVRSNVEPLNEFHSRTIAFYDEMAKTQSGILQCLTDIKKLKEKKLKILIDKCESERIDRLHTRKLLKQKLELKAQLIEMQTMGLNPKIKN